jgi:predicted ribosomally synthesized peptide with SipW-like signal peptide
MKSRSNRIAPNEECVSMSKNRFKQYLMLLTAVGLVAVAAGGGSGTFASFTAETTNAGNTFATGTIVLSNTVNGGAACLSTNGGTTDSNINSSCAAAYTVTLKKPGDSYVGDQLDIKNVGSLSPSALVFTGGSCTDSNAVGETYHGTGSLCGALDVYVQEWTTNSYAVASHCWYGGGTATTCAFSDTKTVATLASAGAQTLTGALPTGTDRFFTIGLQVQSAAGNNIQGRATSSAVTWHVDQ